MSAEPQLVKPEEPGAPEAPTPPEGKKAKEGHPWVFPASANDLLLEAIARHTGKRWFLRLSSTYTDPRALLLCYSKNLKTSPLNSSLHWHVKSEWKFYPDTSLFPKIDSLPTDLPIPPNQDPALIEAFVSQMKKQNYLFEEMLSTEYLQNLLLEIDYIFTLPYESSTLGDTTDRIIKYLKNLAEIIAMVLGVPIVRPFSGKIPERITVLDLPFGFSLLRSRVCRVIEEEQRSLGRKRWLDRIICEGSDADKEPGEPGAATSSTTSSLASSQSKPVVKPITTMPSKPEPKAEPPAPAVSLAALATEYGFLATGNEREQTVEREQTEQDKDQPELPALTSMQPALGDR